MIELAIPGLAELRLRQLVLDYNGTLAEDGVLVPGVGDAIERLSGALAIHVVTADTFGSAARQLAQLPCSLDVLEPGAQDEAKLRFVEQLGAGRTVAVGNGRNDALMLRAAAVGIAVMLREGAAWRAIEHADIVCSDILHALELLTHPRRMVATLRS